jgi:hypothetical protein
MRGILQDARSPVFPSDPRPQTVVPSGAGRVVDADQRGSGWYEPKSTDGWRAPGIEHIDRLVDAQDRVDKARLARELSEAARTTRQLKDHK